MTNIFAYGSLMFEAVLDVLIENRCEKLEARLDGYRRLRVKREVYPGLIASVGHRVDGILLLAIDAADVQVLDRFEGEYYTRQCVSVTVNNGCVLEAETYVFRDEYRDLLSDVEWNVETFSKTDIHAFVSQYRGFFRQ